MRRVIICSNTVIAADSELSGKTKRIVEEFNTIAQIFSKFTGKKVVYAGEYFQKQFNFNASGIKVMAFTHCDTTGVPVCFFGFKTIAGDGTTYTFTLHRWGKWQTHIESYPKGPGYPKELQKWTSVTPETVTVKFFKDQLTDLIKRSKEVVVVDTKIFNVYCTDGDTDENYVVRAKNAAEAKKLVRAVADGKVDTVEDVTDNKKFFKDFGINPNKVTEEPDCYDSGH